jgi:nucleoside-diphosphate-sugar epimerase
MQVRIARFQNCYGPEGTWRGGRVKAPDGGSIEVWGDGSAVRSYTYVDDLVEGVYMLMHSDLEGPVNIGSPEYVTVDELVRTVIDVPGQEARDRACRRSGGRPIPQLQRREDRVAGLAGAGEPPRGDRADLPLDRRAGAPCRRRGECALKPA